MKFIKTYAIILVLCYMFEFFGGWMLFDFRERFYLAVASCAFVIAVVASIFVAQEEKIERLERRVKDLEEKSASDS